MAEGVGVVVGSKQPVSLFSDNISLSADGGAYDGKTGSHTLNDVDRQPFLMARRDQKIRCLIQAVDVAAVTEEMHKGGNAQPFALFPAFLLQSADAGEEHLKPGQRLFQFWQNAQQQLVVLRGINSAT